MSLETTALETAKLLKIKYPEAKTELVYSNLMELAIAVCLSAQTTDKKVNEVTTKLFSKYKTWSDYASADIAELTATIHGVNFHIGKAQRIKALAVAIIKDYNSELPNTMVELIKLPGIARKTANVILSEGYGVAEGIVVDTHVLRVSNRLGLTTQVKPEKVEIDLVKLFPKDSWVNLNNSIVLHGRYTCTARKPNCEECCLNKICPSAFKVQ